METLSSRNESGRGRYCGRSFGDAEVQIIREIIADSERHPTRAAIARAVCERLSWLRPDGRLKDMSARVAVLRMAEDGLITLPAATHRFRTLKSTVFTSASDPSVPITGSRSDLSNLTLRLVEGQVQSRLWRVRIPMNSTTDSG